MKSHFILLLLLCLVLSGWSQSSVGEAVNSMQGGLWNDAASWDCGCVPSAEHDVTILGGHAILVSEADTVRANSVVVTADASLALSASARIEVGTQWVNEGEVEGRVYFVGEGPHQCGPANLAFLDCGVGTTTLMDTVSIRGELSLQEATVETAGMLVLEGASGLTSAGGSIVGQALRRYDWTKTSPYTHQVGSGLAGATASAFLDQPGAVYVKQWVESGTTYQSLIDSDELEVGSGFTCSLPAGNYTFTVAGEPVVSASVNITAEAASASWRGWNLVANPLTGFVDLNAVGTQGPGSLGATYRWVDSLQTWVAQVGGLGLFGEAGIVAPGNAFWTIADTAFTMEFTEASLVSKAQWAGQGEVTSAGVLTMEMADAIRSEQCIVGYGLGDGDYDRKEDAAFSSAFRGRNNLDIYTHTADSIGVMVNRTAAGTETIPVWIKASSSNLLTLEFPTVPDNVCLTLEDVETGWSGGIAPGFTYEFTTTTSSDHHRFNVVRSAGISAAVEATACASSEDGSIEVSGPLLTTSFTLTDAAGEAAGIFSGTGPTGAFEGLGMGTYTVTALTDGCSDVAEVVEVTAWESGEGLFAIQAMPDHIGCYDDHGSVHLDIEGGQAPYTVDWAHGDVGADIDVVAAGQYVAVITDAAGCADTTEVDVLAAPQVEAAMVLEEALVTLVDGEAEVTFGNASTGATSYQWNFGDGSASTDSVPIHVFTAAGAYTVGLNAWNDYCSDTQQTVVTVEMVNSVGEAGLATDPELYRDAGGWAISHAEEAFTVDVFDLTGRIVLQLQGAPGVPLQLSAWDLPAVCLLRWQGARSGGQKTWRIAR